MDGGPSDPARGGAARALHVFATFAAAGPQVRTAQLVRDLGDEYEHTFLALDGDTGARGLLTRPARFLDPPPRAGSLATTRALRRLLAAERPDLLLTYNWGAIDAVLAARTLGLAAVVHHEDGFRPDEARGQKRRRSWYRRLVLPGARRVIVISRTLERIALDVWRLPREQVAFVPNGIDAARFPAADGNPRLRAELAIPTDAVVVGAVGHLRPEKNVARLLAAAARVARASHLHLLVLGEGPERARLEELARVEPLGGRVTFAGHRADPRDCYRAMDLLAISSDTEQMPISLLEAMACGLPAVSTDVGDVAAVLPPEQRRFVVPLERAEEGLAGALAELAGDRGQRARLGAANREHVRANYDLAAMTRAYREIYRAARGGGR